MTFKWPLTMTYPKNFAGMLARVEKYVRIEKAFMLEGAPSIPTLGVAKNTK